MAKVLVTESNLTDIGDAIRDRLQVGTQYLPSEMGDAVRSIRVIDIDTTLTRSGYAADAKVVGDRFNNLLDRSLSIRDCAAEAKATGEAITDLQKNVDDVADAVGVTMIEGFVGMQYIQTNLNVGDTVAINSPQTSSNFSYKVIDVSPGDKITLNATGGNAGRLWAFVDSSNALISKADANAVASNLVLIAPANAVKLVLNVNLNATIGANYIGTSVDSRIANNSELIDIRVGANGTTYPTAGDAVREQVSQINDSMKKINNSIYSKIENALNKEGHYTFSKYDLMQGTIRVASSTWNQYFEDLNAIRTISGIHVKEKSYVHFIPATKINKIIIQVADANGRKFDQIFAEEARIELIYKQDVTFVLRNQNNEPITVDDYDANITIYSEWDDVGNRIYRNLSENNSYIFTKNDLIQGTYSRDSELYNKFYPSDTRLRVESVIKVRKDMRLYFVPGTNITTMRINTSLWQSPDETFDSEKEIIFSNDAEIYIALFNSNNTTITVNDYDATLILGNALQQALPALNNIWLDFKTRMQSSIDRTGEYALTKKDLIQGSYALKSPLWNKYIYSTKKIRLSTNILADNGMYIIFNPGTIVDTMLVASSEIYSSSESFVDNVYTTKSVIPLYNTRINKVILVFYNSNNTNIYPSDFDADVVVRYKKIFDFNINDSLAKMGEYTIQTEDIINGTYTTSAYNSNIYDAYAFSEKRLRTNGLFSVEPGMKIKFKTGNNIKSFILGLRNKGDNHSFADTIITTSQTITFNESKDVIIVFKGETDNTELSPSDYDATVTLYTKNNQGPKEILPSSYTEEVGYKKSQQLTNIKWTPLSQVPKAGGDQYFPANVERTGMLYSDAHTIGKTVGFDVSLKTFMTCVHNPYSLLYTENINKDNSASAYGNVYYGDYLAGAYMGSACNLFVAYALGCDIPYSSFEINGWCVESGIYERIYNQSGTGLKLMDVIWQTGHVRLVTRLWSSSRGVVEKIQISECTRAGAVNDTVMTVDEFDSLLTSINGVILRYRYLYQNIHYEPSAFVRVEEETTPTYIYNDDICTFAGDYACFSEGDKIYINYTKSDYVQMELYKNDTLLETIDLDTSSNVHVVNLTDRNLIYGKYKARLKNETNYSNYTYFEIINATIQLSGDILSFETENAVPLYYVWVKESNGYSYKKTKFSQTQIASGQADVSDKNADYTKIKVYFQGNYGRIFRSIST